MKTLVEEDNNKYIPQGDSLASLPTRTQCWRSIPPCIRDKTVKWLSPKHPIREILRRIRILRSVHWNMDPDPALFITGFSRYHTKKNFFFLITSTYSKYIYIRYKVIKKKVTKQLKWRFFSLLFFWMVGFGLICTNKYTRFGSWFWNRSWKPNWTRNFWLSGTETGNVMRSGSETGWTRIQSKM